MGKSSEKEERELGLWLDPQFDDRGLLPVIVQDFQTLEVLMFAWMNREALEITLKTGNATFFSRSRQKLWVKGESSGRFQKVREILVDCDQDVLLLKVDVQEPGVCHQGFRSCFYRKVLSGEGHRMVFAIEERAFDPEKVYRPRLGPDREGSEEKRKG